MGRNYSRKPTKDVEAASETVIPAEFGSITLRKINKSSTVMPVSASLESSPVFNDFSDKKTK